MTEESQLQIEQPYALMFLIEAAITLFCLLFGFFYPPGSGAFYSLSIVGIVITAIVGSKAINRKQQ